MPLMKTSGLICANPKVLWREIDGEVVLLEPSRGHYYGIEGVGVHIWRLLQKTSTIEGLLRRLVKEYDEKPADLRKDVQKFIERLKSSGLAVTV